MNKPHSKKIIISGTGCAIADLIYNRVSFDSPGFQKYVLKQPCDGGLSPGKLVFTEEMEKFSGKPYPEILRDLVGNRQPDKMNVGGPSLVIDKKRKIFHVNLVKSGVLEFLLAKWILLNGQLN